MGSGMLGRLICRLFGHRPLTTDGWCGDTGYADVQYEQTDGLNTRHLYLSTTCRRCGEEYRICNVHVPKYEGERNGQ